MANNTTDDLEILSDTDLFSSKSKSDHSSIYLANNSKQLKTNSDEKQMLYAQNTNAPALFNILKKKFQRFRKHKKEEEEFLEKPISNDGTSGKWIINEKEISFPLIKIQTNDTIQYNISHAMSTIPNSTDESSHQHHYHYDFQTISSSSSSSILNDSQPPPPIPLDLTSIASRVKTYYSSSRQQIEIPLLSTLEPITEDKHLVSGNSTTQTTSKRAKSASAARNRRTNSSNTTKRTRKKKKSKYYQEHFLTPEEIELREALRIIDLDNIGFFPPSELRKVLQEIGIKSNDIEKIERCLPIDEDGHYSTDNLIKLFLGTK